MKRYFAPVVLFVLSLALLLASVPSKNAGAQGRPDDPGHQSAVRADGKVVAPDGVVFESQKAFVDAGRRCSTRHADDLELEDIERDVKSNRASSGRGNGNGAGSDIDAARNYPNGSITIPVQFHVDYRTDGTGNIPDSRLDAQIAAMNEHFTGLDTPAIEQLPLTCRSVS
jgi:hypothetical protein